MNLPEYIGHLHPVLVHLPIGILLTAILFEGLSRRKGFRKLRKSVQPMLFLGFVSAAFSSFTGFMLSQSGDYDAGLLSKHQWLGISVSVLSLIVLLFRRRKEMEMKVAYAVLLVAMAVLILLTGHAGGTLTHGPDFLKPPALGSWFGTEEERAALPDDLHSAFLYTDLVAPILQAKCTRCHGASRQKGKLRLDQPEFILKGGEDGAVVQVDPWEESEIFKRIHLEADDEDHMPPKGKSQLTRQEVSILSYWIATGADFKSKLNLLPQSDSMITRLTDPTDATPEEENSDQELERIAYPDAETIGAFRNGGVAVSFIRQDDGRLALNFMNADTAQYSLLVKELPRLQKNLIELKLMGGKLSHEEWTVLSKLTSLSRLHLENANLTDQDLSAIQSLPNLQYLNLVGTAVTRAGLEPLKDLPALRKLFLFHTHIQESERDAVRQLFPKATVDFGNYHLPMLPGDTSIVTKPYIIPN